MTATLQEIQIVADIRLMTLSACKVAGYDARTLTYRRTMNEIRALCDGLIKAGPVGYHHIIEEAASAGDIDHELRRRAYPNAYR